MNLLRSSLTVAAALLVTACGQSTGKVSLMLTDAPGDFKAAVVTISKIELVGSGGATVLSTTKTTTNLLTLANDTAALVKDVDVPVGTYAELRFVITGGYVEVEQAGGGSAIYATSPTYEGLPEGAQVAGTLGMPSFAESGLKVKLPGGHVTVGTAATVLLVDFDVAQSFGQQAGGSGSWVMHPELTATDFGLSGTVNVTLRLGDGVTLPSATTLAQVSAVLTNDAGTSKTLALATNATGAYAASFKYLIPGSYTLTFAAPVAFTTAPVVPAAVTVASGQATAADFTIVSAP